MKWHSDRSEVGRALRDSEARHRLIVEAAHDYAIFTASPQGLIDSWSPGAAAIFGWSEEEAIGMPAARLFTEEDQAAGEPAREVAKAAVDGVAPDVRWHLCKDGSKVFIEGSTRALRDGHGRLRGFLKIGQDVTQRRQAEAALRESEDRFRTLATSIPQLVFCSRGTGERTWGSSQWEMYTGLSDFSSRGYGWMDALHPMTGKQRFEHGSKPVKPVIATSSIASAALRTGSIVGIKHAPCRFRLLEVLRANGSEHPQTFMICVSFRMSKRSCSRNCSIAPVTCLP